MDNPEAVPQMGIQCRVCKIVKISEEFPDDTLYDECDHAPLCCHRCVLKSKEDFKCKYPGCNVDSNSSAKELAKKRIAECEKVLKYMFTPKPSGTDAHSTEGQEYLWIVSLGGSIIPIPCREVGSILELRGKVMKRLKNKVKLEEAQLTFNGQELQDYDYNTKCQSRMTLSDYSIENGSIIHLQKILRTINSAQLKHVKFEVKWPYTGRYSDAELEAKVSDMNEAIASIHDYITNLTNEQNEVDERHAQLEDEYYKSPTDFKTRSLMKDTKDRSQELKNYILNLQKEHHILEISKVQLIEEDLYTEFLDLSCIVLKNNCGDAVQIDKNKRELNGPKKRATFGKYKSQSKKGENVLVTTPAITHSGDAKNDDEYRTGHQEIQVNFDEIPREATHLAFVASAFVEDEKDVEPNQASVPRITLSRFRNIKLSVYDVGEDKLCNTDIDHAREFTAVILCLLVRKGKEWQVIESGMPSNGSILNYAPIVENIRELIKQRQL